MKYHDFRVVLNFSSHFLKKKLKHRNILNTNSQNVLFPNSLLPHYLFVPHSARYAVQLRMKKLLSVLVRLWRSE